MFRIGAETFGNHKVRIQNFKGSSPEKSLPVQGITATNLHNILTKNVHNMYSNIRNITNAKSIVGADYLDCNFTLFIF